MNQELKNIQAQELIKALEADGFQWTHSKGSHRVYRHFDGRRVVVSYHRPGATFPPKTLMAMLKGAGWSEDDLRRLKLIS
jgi:predicted RNA binding protein YcfA (HicA-like mRNA interferase family)